MEIASNQIIEDNKAYYEKLTDHVKTAIAFETGKGEFALGLALGIILLIIAMSVNFSAHYSMRK